MLERARRSSLRDLRSECARTKAAADPDADARYERVRRERSLRTFTDREGAWNLCAHGPADAGARVMAALNPLIDEVFNAARTQGRCEPAGAYAFDALIALSDRSGEGGPAAEPGSTAQPGGTVQPDGAAGGARRPKRTNVKYLALLRLDLEALTRGMVEDEECCEITGLGPVPIRVARALLGDSVLELVLTRGKDVANIVHLGRGPTAAQKIALLWSQPGCSRLGCDQPWHRLQTDHRTDWADTHHTVLGELDRLCPFDHRLKTVEGWALVPGAGRRAMVPPDHPLHPRHAHGQPHLGGRPPPAAPAPAPALFDTG
ncbi:MAG: hypothetical protein GEV08_04855 [Acidimicrobiia bacterium]|nr:hypothetical protein [Acidimicrobiia bacterium]